ncbi:unnamed protein product [Orchesella dallaii]|uniref:Endoplasmic reticulum transmembrane protein n=1 Tax=Orchesella dallaii TaxID=48710 RepID=A0ABP1QMZ1_9HEXA
MGYWWVGTAWFVHCQIIVILLSLSPFGKPRFWNKILGSRFITFINEKLWNIYILIGIPSLLVFLDSLRELHKYSAAEYDMYGDPITRKDAHIALLRAQRNYFISGAAVVLCLIVPKLMTILKENGELSLRNDATKSAFKSFRRLIDAMDVEGELGTRERERELEYGSQGGNGRPQNPTTPISRALISAMQTELERLAKDGINVNSSGVDDTRQRQLERDELEQIIREYEQNRTREQVRPPQPSQFWNRPLGRDINNNHTYSTIPPRRQPIPTSRFGLF